MNTNDIDPKLKSIGEKVRSQTNIPEDENFGTVMVILMIISIIISAIRMIQECRKNKKDNFATAQDKYKLYGDEIKSYSIRRGWLTKLRIKKLIRKNMSKEQYDKYGTSLLQALLNSGENLKEDEIATLVENSNV